MCEVQSLFSAAKPIAIHLRVYRPPSPLSRSKKMTDRSETKFTKLPLADSTDEVEKTTHADGCVHAGLRTLVPTKIGIESLALTPDGSKL